MFRILLAILAVTSIMAAGTGGAAAVPPDLVLAETAASFTGSLEWVQHPPGRSSWNRQWQRQRTWHNFMTSRRISNAPGPAAPPRVDYRPRGVFVPSWNEAWGNCHNYMTSRRSVCRGRYVDPGGRRH